MFEKSGRSKGGWSSRNKKYYDLSGKQIGKSEGDYASTLTNAEYYGDQPHKKAFYTYYSNCTYFDINNKIAGYSDGTEQCRNYYDSDKKLIGFSKNNGFEQVDFYNDKGSKIGESIGDYYKTYFGNVPFLDRMLSVTKEMDEKAATLVNTILNSPNEYEATKQSQALLKNGDEQPLFINSYINNTTPLLAAIDKDYLSVTQQLIKFGANPNLQQNKEGFTPLTKIASQNNAKFIEPLVKNGANLELFDSRGYNPLTAAVSKNNFDSAVRLLDLGAKINAKDNFGKSPLNWARENANKDMVTYLRSRGARRCWLHELLGKGDELFGFEKNEKSFTNKMWNYVADRHSLFAGVGAIFATPFTGLFDGCNYSYNKISGLFKSNDKIIEIKSLEPKGFEAKTLEPKALDAKTVEAKTLESKNLEPKTFHDAVARRRVIDFRIIKEELSSSKRHSKNTANENNIERPYAPGQRPGGYDIKANKSVMLLQEKEKELAS